MEHELGLVVSYNGISVYTYNTEELLFTIPYYKVSGVVSHYSSTVRTVLYASGGVTYIEKDLTGALVVGNTNELYACLTKKAAVRFIASLNACLKEHNFMIAAREEEETNKPTLEERVAAIEQKLVALETNVPVLQL